jgi:hypothetical protein
MYNNNMTNSKRWIVHKISADNVIIYDSYTGRLF